MKKVLFLAKVQPSYDMKCEESSILKSENVDKNLKIFFLLFQFKIMKIL